MFGGIIQVDDDDDNDTPSSPTGEDSILMKSVGGKSAGSCVGSGTGGSSSGTSSGMTLSSEPQNLIHDLLEALTTLKDDPEPAAAAATGTSGSGTGLSNTTPTEERSANSHSIRRQLHLSRSSSANDMVVQETDEQVRNVMPIALFCLV